MFKQLSKSKKTVKPAPMKKIGGTALLLSCLSSLLLQAMPPVEAQVAPREHVPNTFLCKTQAGHSSYLYEILQRAQCLVNDRLTFDDEEVLVVTGAPGTTEAQTKEMLQNLAPIFNFSIQYNYFLSKQSANSPPVSSNSTPPKILPPTNSLLVQQWHLGQAHIPEAWRVSTGRFIRVAMIDTGAANIPDLRRNVRTHACSGILELNQRDIPDHGTSIASTIAATSGIESSISLGTTGVAPACEVESITAVDDQRGRATDASLMRAISMAARDQARIINIGFNDPDASLTNSDYHPFVRDWCQKFFNHGGLVFLPSGNKAGAFDDTPRTQSMIVVSGFGRDTHLLNDSATGYSTWFSGPGDQILCESRTGAIVSRHGTSYSSAIVAGIAALTWSVNQNLSNTQVLDTLVQATGRNRPSVMFGYGLPDANTAVNLAQCTNTRAGQGQADNRNLSSPGAGPAAH